MEYIIYRDKKSNEIISYSQYKKEPQELDNLIEQYNSTHDRIAERVISDDMKYIIQIAEKNKQLRLDDIKSIEYAFDNLQTELYNLKERFNL